MAVNGRSGPRKSSGRSANGRKSADNSGNGVEGQIIPPPGGDANGQGTNVYAQVLANIKQYTDRPDLLLEVMERNDPGFIKSMNDEARQVQREQRQIRFTFGKWQAYSTLFVQVVSAFALLGVLYLLAIKGTLSFSSGLVIAIFFAISQSGVAGFRKIVDHVAAVIKHTDKKGGK